MSDIVVETAAQAGHPANSEHGVREKRRVALTSVVAAVALTSLKIVVGLATGSLGILSEALHSGLDLVAAVVTLVAVRASGRPADAAHSYGHGKIENLSALFETMLLLGTCVWIIVEAIERLVLNHVEVDASTWAFAVMAASIVIDVSRSRALRRVARRYSSQALEADALHFSTDVWSSSVVIGGLVLVRLGNRLGIPWLVKGDAVAALGVALIVIWISYQLGRKTIGDLVDEVPPGLLAEVAYVARVPGVIEVDRARVRRSGPEAFVDLRLRVAPGSSFEASHGVATEAEAAVHRLLPGADVVVHVEPADAARDGAVASDPAASVAGPTHNAIRRLALDLGLGAHSVRTLELGGKWHVELHLEVSETLNVASAHELTERLEAALRGAYPRIARIVTHIEPRGLASKATPQPSAEGLVAGVLQDLATYSRPPWTVRALSVTSLGPRLDVSFACLLAPETPIVDAHALTDAIEQQLRARIPALGTVVIHVEPAATPPID